MGEPNQEALLSFYKTYGFKGLVKSLESGSDELTNGTESGLRSKRADSKGGQDLWGESSEQGAPQPKSALTGPTHYETITEWAQFDRWLEKLRSAQWTALDTETTSLVEMTVPT